MTQQIVRPRPPAEEQDAAALASMELVDRFKGGDPQAFDLIYRRYQGLVFNYTKKKIGGHRQLAEDITQDVFVRALGRLQRFEWRGTDLAAWLLTIARNLIADHFKAAARREEPVADPPVTAERDTAPGPDDAAIGYLSNVDLLQLLFELTEDQQDVLILRFLRGLSVAETSAEMDRNEGVVKALTYRATQSMRRRLQQARVERRAACPVDPPCRIDHLHRRNL